VCTKKQYEAKERKTALTFAPPAPISEQEFVYQATFYPLSVLRCASMRYSGARGRSHKQVLSRFVSILSNPHVNRGDDYRIALGHIMATYEWMREEGLL
jgi:hypothetical protein